MILCPIAFSIGCNKCLAAPVCLPKEIIGNYQAAPIVVETPKSSSQTVAKGNK